MTAQTHPYRYYIGYVAPSVSGSLEAGGKGVNRTRPIETMQDVLAVQEHLRRETPGLMVVSFSLFAD